MTRLEFFITHLFEYRFVDGLVCSYHKLTCILYASNGMPFSELIYFTIDTQSPIGPPPVRHSVSR